MGDDELFRALADASRRRLLDRLREANGQTLSELSCGFEMSRQAISKHLTVLEQADLVVVRWDGREKRHYLNCVPINEIAERWIADFQKPHVQALTQLQRRLEGEVS